MTVTTHEDDPAPLVCTVSDQPYFLGTVGLLNSLRLHGYTERLLVLDCGLTARQRASLQPHCTLIPIDPTQAKNPAQFKPFAHQVNPRGVVVLVDSDMVITRRFDSVLELARAGKICAYPDPEPFAHRWFAEWQQIFELPSAPRRETYVNSGFVVFSTRHWPRLLPDWWAACQRIWAVPTLYEGADHLRSPTSLGDQDALNAVLMSAVPAGAVVTLPEDEAPAQAAFREGVRIVDLETLACAFRGRRTQLLHGAGSPKPWNRGAWLLLRGSPYPRLLRRLLDAPDVAVRVPRDSLPRWLRNESDWSVRLLDGVNALVWRALWRKPIAPLARWAGRHLRAALL